MPSIEHTERFLAECLLYRAAMKAKPLTRWEMVHVRTRLYELLCDMDEEKRLREDICSALMDRD